MTPEELLMRLRAAEEKVEYLLRRLRESEQKLRAVESKARSLVGQ